MVNPNHIDSVHSWCLSEVTSHRIRETRILTTQCLPCTYDKTIRLNIDALIFGWPYLPLASIKCADFSIRLRFLFLYCHGILSANRSDPLDTKILSINIAGI